MVHTAPMGTTTGMVTVTLTTLEAGEVMEAMEEEAGLQVEDLISLEARVVLKVELLVVEDREEVLQLLEVVEDREEGEGGGEVELITDMIHTNTCHNECYILIKIVIYSSSKSLK